MSKKEKSFNLKLYAVITFIAVAVFLTLIVLFTFKSKYTAFHPDEVARNYVDTIVQTGDGYNAYKYSVVSKNDKYGNFIRKNYMYPIIYKEAGYKPGDDTKNLKGYNDKSFIGEKTQNDNGSLQGQVIEAMYDYYLELIANGWDNYDEFFNLYFAKLCEVRENIFGDKYMTDEIMFTALESNVKSYGDSLVGTVDSFDENTGNQISYESIGAYQEKFGNDYKFTTTVVGETEIDLGDYKSNVDQALFTESYGIDLDSIEDVKCFTVEVKTDDGNAVTSADITVVKIKSSWYVDNTTTDTSALYAF